jgi:diguanylate cyclase (GGDEF)-like protein
MADVPPNSNWKDLVIFHNLARALTSSLDLEGVLHAIMDQMRNFFEPETWSLLILDETRQELYYAVAAGAREEDLKSMRIKVGEGIAGWVALHGESVIVPEISTEDSRFQTPGSRLRIKSAICMPLRSRQRTLGVIQLFNCRLETMTDYTISFLHILCDYAAIAIENARAMERIQALTITDDCTGLYNQRRLHHVLDEEVERCRRSGCKFSLIFIDLDHFKAVNDHHGHLVGSRLLSEVGDLLRSCVGPKDLAFRYGGDEFILLLDGIGKSKAEQTARALHQRLRNHVFGLGSHLALKITASFGVASFPEDGHTGQEIIRAADAMMYLVKGSTRDDVAVAERSEPLTRSL